MTAATSTPLDTDAETVLLDVDADGVAVITFNRPRRHNAFTDAFDDAFFTHLETVHGHPDVRVVLIRGEGKSFSSGRDTAELGKREPGVTDYDFIKAGHDRTKLLLTMPTPTIAALKGWTLGGSFERALLCDLRIAAQDTRMSLPEVGHGVIPDSGGVARLFQMAGHGLAMDLALTGRVMTADEALTHGVVSRVVPTEELDTAASELARTIASRSPLAVQLARNTINQLATPAVVETIDRELLAQTACMADPAYRAARDARLSGQ